MNSRIVIIHGWADKPGRGWLGWLADKLTSDGYEVVNPQMPRAKKPEIDEWLSTLSSAIGKLDADTVLVGHSLGTYILLRYLSAYRGDERAKALFLVAGFTDPGYRSAKEIFATKPDTKQVEAHADQFFHYISRDDSMVEAKRSLALAGELPGIERIYDDRGHFTATDISTFPELYEDIKLVLENN